MKKILSIFTVLVFVFVLVACGSNSYTVTFNTNEGSSVAAIEVKEGEIFNAPTAPTRSGFTFDGWYKESSLTNIWNFESDIVESDITLYAKWSPVGLTDQQKVDAAHTALTLGDLTNLTNASSRIILPASGQNNVTITWVIDKLQYIAANGVITQPTYEEGEQTVTLTATITLGTVSRTKVFTATVKALPSVEETLPVMDETFDYTLGNILNQTTPWGPVSGKSGNSVFTVVDTITGMSIPQGSNALKIEAFLELQIEAPVVHAYGLIVFEVDLMQTTSSNGSAINIQSSSSSPVVAFGLDGASLFYRIDNGTLIKTNINVNQWYTLRAEVNLANKTLEVFYYEDGQLISMTPGPVTYTGTTAFQSLFIRSGSSNTTELRAPAYITNIIANRVEALPRPIEQIKLGDVEGIRATVSVAEDGVFTVDTPTIHNYYGTQRALVITTEYTLAVTNPVDTAVPGDYTVTYTFTNVSDATDTKVVTQEVTVYAVGEPNEITAATASATVYPDRLTDIEVSVVQPLGNLFYIISNNATETAAAILAGTSVEITGTTASITDLFVGENLYIHFIVSLNGESNIFTVTLVHQEVEEIATAQQFYDAVQTNSSSKYFLLTADIDMTGFVWTDPSYNGKLTSTFDGAGFTVSNLTITKATKGGIFADIDGGTIKNIIFDNVHMTATAGVSSMLVGESRGISVIENVVIMNSSSIGNADYAALVVSRVRNGSLRISNLSVIDSNVEGKKDYAGGLVAGTDIGSSIIFEDIYLNNFELLEATADTGQMAGIIIGRIQGNTEMKRIVAVNIFVRGIKNIGGLIGKSDEPGTTVTLTDIYLEGSVERLDIANNNYGSIAANISDQIPTLTNVWVSGFAEVGTLSLDVAPENKVVFATIQNQAWWNTNIPAILASDLWVFAESGTPVLVDAVENMLPYFTVTLDYNFDFANDVIQVRQGNMLTYSAPIHLGYAFVGWFTDIALTTALAEGFTVTEDITLYGKYEEIAKFTVTFEVNSGSAVADLVDIYDGSTILKPLDPTKDGFTFEGWYKEAEFTTLWNFDTDLVTANVTLYARWEEIPAVTYTVSFEVNGGSLVADLLLVGDGTTISEPAEPTKDGFTFIGWYKEVELTNLWVFASDTVTANITLYASWEEIVPIEITTAQEFIDMLNAPVANRDYLLMNNVDVTGLLYTPTSFAGKLDGQGFSVTGLSFNGLGKAGMFSVFKGEVANLTIINSSIVSTNDRAGMIAGEVDVETAVVHNVHFDNVSVSGASDNGAGIIAGLIVDAKGGITISQISIINSSVTNTGTRKNTGGLIGYVRGSGDTLISDVYIKNLSVTGANDQVGGVVGYVNNPKSFTLNNVVIDGITVTKTAGTGGYVSSVLGRIATGISIKLSNILVVNDVMRQDGSLRYGHTIAGRYPISTDFTLTNVYSGVTVYETITTPTPITFEGQGALVVLTDLNVLNTVWFETNMPSLTTPIWNFTNDIPVISKVSSEPIITFDVLFNVDGGSSVVAQEIEENGLVFEPIDPTKDGFTFEGWYKEVELTNLWVFASDMVTANITLYAKWNEVVAPPAGTAISTAQEFHDMTKSGSIEEFYLANDIDFTGFTWTVTDTGTAFRGVLNGNGKTISNITITGEGTIVYGGIFQITNGAVIHDLTIDNANVDLTGVINLVGRVGVLIGRVESSVTTITNVTIMNSSAAGTAGEGVGIAIGNAASGFTVTNLKIINSTALNSNKNVSLVVGRSDNAATLTDVYIFGSTAESTNLSTDAGVGGIVGYTNHANSAITMTRVVIEDSILKGRSAGSLVGYFRFGGLTATDVFTDIEFVYAGTNGQHGVIGRRNVDANTTDPVFTNVFAHYITQQPGVAIQLDSANVLADLTGLDQTWWTSNLSGLTGNTGWSFNAVSKFYALS